MPDFLNVLVLDTETTGFEETDAVVEIGAALIRFVPDDPARSVIVDNSSVLVDPKMPIPNDVKAVHHITEEDVRDCPELREGYRMLLSRLGILEFEIDYFVAHKADFDKKFLSSAIDTTTPWVCTYKVAATFFPEFKSHKNAAVFYELGIRETDPEHWKYFFDTQQLHRAGPDSYLTASFFPRLAEKASIEKMKEITESPLLLHRVGFGKHKDELWSEVPKGYLKWIVGQSDFDEDVLHTARHYLVN